MAGVVAMASVIEDFDTQSCNKSHKESSSPVVKTITNYFSPVVKTGEKPFSPPRSNNIMDYFSRKASSSKEKTSSPEQSKENCKVSQSAEKTISPGAAVKQPSQKRGRKTSKAARKLVEAETGSSSEEASCLIVQESNESKDEPTEMISGICGSDTAALLAQIKDDACDTAGTSKSAATVIDLDHVEIDEDHKADPKSENIIKNTTELKSFPLSPVVHSNDKANQVKSAAQNLGKDQEAKQPEPDDNSLCDVSMEVNVDEHSQLNNSTVTISFEDFVRSQSQNSGEEGTEDKWVKAHENENISEIEKMDVGQLDCLKTEQNLGSEEALLQVSPRTLTIQAEVHVLSSKQEPVKTVGKLASIFTKRKGASSPAEAMSPTHAEAEAPCTVLPVKRRSNVVLQEEDLELAVLESESLPKSSEAERKQFMAAFKQPSLDGSKTKLGKNHGKQKHPEEKDFGLAEENTAVPPSSEEVVSSTQESNAISKEPAKKGRKKLKDRETVTSLDTAEETATLSDDKKEEFPVTSAPSIPAVRRSRREVVVRNKPESAPAIPVRKTRKLGESKDAAAAAPDSLVKMSTPKTRKSKHVYVAEMLCPPDTKESPIRIKFTRVHKDVSTLKTESGSGLNSSLTNKTLNESKKRRQAKKLVEKAKIIQQSKKTCVEEKGTLRRSSRNEAANKRSYCEDEDSIICVEEDQTQAAREKKKPSKALRSLNDVLGKAAQATKDTKSIQVQEKTTRKVSIFDESSRECSENSQDDEQFKARREFLKSGLPESFRKQIAKTAANKEAYSLSCSSFQPVVHMKQPPTDCPVWSLPWPESPLLSHLKEFSSRSSTYLLPGSSSFRLRTKPTYRSLCERSSGWRPGISESVRQLLVEEISTSNPPFPVHMFLTRFLKRRTDHQQHCTDSEPATSGVTHAPLPAEPVGGKRKRMDDEGENAVKVAKKQRANDSQEKTFTPELQPKKRGGRTRRSQRSVVEEKEEIAVGSDKASPLPPKDDSVIIVDDLLLGEDTGVTDVVKEDVLWTDKYQPQHSSDILGNSAAVRRLHSWLREWKLRADREERKKQKDKKQEEGSNDSDWDCGEEESQDGEDLLCNTMLITGPTGVGKTAAVYACAQELGFKVFEVNASSQRSGRLILSQLREATQSHQVDSQGVNAHKPTYFSSYSTNSSAGSVRVGSSPRKINSPCRVVSSPRKLPQSPRGAKRGLAPTSLANFFKMGQPTNKQLRNTLKNERPACSKKTVTENESTNKKKDLSVKSPAASTPNEESKKMATSLILFEEVDVIFDDDSGFLSAIKTFMATTKRPVILTTSDPSFGAMFDGSFDEIRFTTPSVLSVATYLQLLCLAEDVRTDLSDVSSLLKLNGCDIRQSLLQLQFWTRSTGGRQTTRALTHTGQHTKLKPETDEEAADLPMLPTLPSCDTGCTESRLGLFNIEPERDIWELLRRSEEEAVCQELLADSRRRGVDLLYSNMEALLPLPLTSLTTSTHKPEHVGSQNLTFVNMKEPLSSTCLQPEMLPSHTRVLHTAESGDFSDDGSPVKISSRMKKNKKRNCLADKDGLHSDSDSEDGFLSIRKSRSDSQANEEVKESLVSETAKRKPPTPEERVKGLLVSQCLESVADFLDSMSYMDSSLLVQTEGGDIRKTPVGATIKDGLTDEWRVETNRRGWVRAEHVLEIQSAVESLSFHRCWASVAEAWDGAQKLDGELGKGVAAALTLPVASHCEGYGFTQDSPCQPQLVQRRKEVMESLMLRNVGTLGNRAAASLDYLPTLRTICRSEQLKEQGKVKRRFLHYLDAIHLGLEKSTLQHLAEDFP